MLRRETSFWRILLLWGVLLEGYFQPLWKEIILAPYLAVYKQCANFQCTVCSQKMSRKGGGETILVSRVDLATKGA